MNDVGFYIMRLCLYCNRLSYALKSFINKNIKIIKNCELINGNNNYIENLYL